MGTIAVTALTRLQGVRWLRALCFGMGTALLAGCSSAPPAFRHTTPLLPEGATGHAAKPGWATQRFAVAAANPLATEAGYEVLKTGGSAVDAAVAVQMVLALVEPQSSGIGGGAFLLHYDGVKVHAYDGRETAPAAADEGLFLGPDGQPLPFHEAVVGGRAVGVPGVLRMLELAHQRHGNLPWARLLAPAIGLAETGFQMSPRLHALLKVEQHLRKDPVAAAYFYQADGSPHPVGYRLRNPALAQVLKRIAREGSSALHEGVVAQALVDKVRLHSTNPGRMTLDDLARYQPRERAALCHDYHVIRAEGPGKDYRICGFPPPSSGGIAVGQILGMLQQVSPTPLPLHLHYRFDDAPPGCTKPPCRPSSTTSATSFERSYLPSPEFLHAYSEVARLAFADRALYVADPDFVPAPGGDWASLLDPAYLAQRARLIDVSPQGRRMPQALPGQPSPTPFALGAMPPQEEHGTSHISIVDDQGHAVAMTTTIEDAFGARQMVHGFMLNNQLTDFSMAPTDAQGRPIANRVQPGKRPRSSMSPTLVFEKNADGSLGSLVLTGGSPGGGFIIHFVAKTLYATLNWQLNAQQAIDLPNFGSIGGPVLLEQQRFSPATVDALKARGHVVRELDLASGLQAIQKIPSGYFGGADPRREGVVRGD